MAKKRAKTDVSDQTDPKVEDIDSTQINDTDERVESDGDDLTTALDVQDGDVESDAIVDAELVAEEPPAEEIETTEAEHHTVEPVSTTPDSGGGVGFLTLLIGGLVAGAIGYGASYLQSGSSANLDAQTARLSELETRIANKADASEVSEVSSSISSLDESVQQVRDEIGAQLSSISDDISTISERVDVLERQPNSDGTLSETALKAYEDDLAELRDQLTEQETSVRELVDSATQQLSATRQEALAIEEQAVKSARDATARSALSRVQTALDTGAPYENALNDLRASLVNDVPEALSAGSDGVPTLSYLQDTFPENARLALATARSENVSGEEAGGLTGFLRNQFDVRSVAPQEGTSVDAILSRAEADVRNGLLDEALTEVATLPEVVRGIMSNWIAEAEMRAAAVDAASQLAEQLNSN